MTKAEIDYLSNIERLATEYQSPEIQRLIEIGRATEKALFLHGTFISGVGVRVRCIDELLEWAANEGKAGEGTK